MRGGNKELPEVSKPLGALARFLPFCSGWCSSPNPLSLEWGEVQGRLWDGIHTGAEGSKVGRGPRALGNIPKMLLSGSWSRTKWVGHRGGGKPSLSSRPLR